MLGAKPKWFRYSYIVITGIICPLIILAMLIYNFVIIKASDDTWLAQVVYWIVSLSPILIVAGFGVYEMYKVKKLHGYIDWVFIF